MIKSISGAARSRGRGRDPFDQHSRCVAGAHAVRSLNTAGRHPTRKLQLPSASATSTAAGQPELNQTENNWQ